MEQLLKDILNELRYLNSHNRDMEERLSALEGKDRLLSPKDAAEYLGVSYHTLRARRDRGYLHLVIRGGQKGYLLSELKAIKY